MTQKSMQNLSAMLRANGRLMAFRDDVPLARPCWKARTPSRTAQRTLGEGTIQRPVGPSGQRFRKIFGQDRKADTVRADRRHNAHWQYRRQRQARINAN